MRTIDADALEVVTAKVPKGMDAKSYMAGMEYVLSQIDALPTIEERKTGKWIRTDKTDIVDGKHINWVKWNCSECGVEKKIGWAKGVKFCPNCGAKMEGTQP